MKITKYHVLVGIIVLTVVFLAALLGIWIGRGVKGYRTIAEGIIIKNDDNSHDSELLKAYSEYTDLLSDLGIAKDVFLTAGDFNEKDYIVDYIYYEEGLKIKEINLDITEAGTIIEYEVNKKVEDSDEILIYFIQIEKDSLRSYKFASREFKVK